LKYALVVDLVASTPTSGDDNQYENFKISLFLSLFTPWVNSMIRGTMLEKKVTN
jgi:hypothetical protein